MSPGLGGTQDLGTMPAFPPLWPGLTRAGLHDSSSGAPQECPGGADRSPPLAPHIWGPPLQSVWFSSPSENRATVSLGAQLRGRREEPPGACGAVPALPALRRGFRKDRLPAAGVGALRPRPGAPWGRGRLGLRGMRVCVGSALERGVKRDRPLHLPELSVHM